MLSVRICPVAHTAVRGLRAPSPGDAAASDWRDRRAAAASLRLAAMASSAAVVLIKCTVPSRTAPASPHVPLAAGGAHAGHDGQGSAAGGDEHTEHDGQGAGAECEVHAMALAHGVHEGGAGGGAGVDSAEACMSVSATPPVVSGSPCGCSLVSRISRCVPVSAPPMQAIAIRRKRGGSTQQPLSVAHRAILTLPVIFSQAGCGISAT